MPKTVFILKNRITSKGNPIILFYTCHDGRLNYYTGERAFKSDWPANVNKGTKAQLNRITARAEELTVDYKIKGEPLTKAILKASLDQMLNKKQREGAGNYFAAMTAVIDQMQSGELLTPHKKRYSPGSIKTFRFTASFLKSFDPNLSASNVSMNTYHRFIRFMQKKNYSLNYIGSQIKNWKTLGKAIGGSNIYDDPAFKKIQEDSFDIYLDEKELSGIFRLKLSSRQDLARDWFILDCYTGLRVSDLVLLTKKNYSKGFITIANKKTDEKVIIPVHPFVRKILDKHKGFPPTITDVEINREIKKVAAAANIDSEVLHTITKGGRRVDSYLKKWQMVSNHTARRSFITNLLKNGVPDTIVMKLTGIKSAETLKRYNKLGVDEAAKIAARHKFFK